MNHRPTSRIRVALLGALYLVTALAVHAGSPPVITGPNGEFNISASQQAYPSNKVNITYAISDPDSSFVTISIFVSQDSGATWSVPAVSFTGTGAPGTLSVSLTPAVKSVVWDAGADWDGHFTSRCRVRVLATDDGAVGVPGVTYTRGNAISADTDITDAPPYQVAVGPFYIDPTLVSGGLWILVKEYAAGQNLGYDFGQVGSFQRSDHPVHTISWLDAVKWCNARSQMVGLTPVYYSDGPPNYAVIYKTGLAVAPSPYTKPGANGYRLPTEAEWEKAARGGALGLRFPWGGTINWTRANYVSSYPWLSITDYPSAALSYDTQVVPVGSPPIAPFLSDLYDHRWAGGSAAVYGGYNYANPRPFTSPVTSFPPNGYNLYDMAGNVHEWCWDWYSPTYYAAGQTDPQGPDTGTQRVLRGGSWNDLANYARCANRHKGAPASAYNTVGFRCVRNF